jgi:hypothetical protein
VLGIWFAVLSRIRGLRPNIRCGCEEWADAQQLGTSDRLEPACYMNCPLPHLGLTLLRPVSTGTPGTYELVRFEQLLEVEPCRA